MASQHLHSELANSRVKRVKWAIQYKDDPSVSRQLEKELRRGNNVGVLFTQCLAKAPVATISTISMTALPQRPPSTGEYKPIQTRVLRLKEKGKMSLRWRYLLPHKCRLGQPLANVLRWSED